MNRPGPPVSDDGAVGAEVPLALPPSSAPIGDARTLAQSDPTRSNSLPTEFSFLSPAQGPDELGRLGPYRVLSVLGAGGMGLVFRAEDVALQRLVALKVIRPDQTTDVMKKRFIREARTAAKVEHDHIVTIYRVDEANGVPYIAMPLLRGRPLNALAARGPLPASEVARIGREIALGLAAAQDRGLIHRDIKPGNLWVEEPSAEDTIAGKLGRIKILDFGLARGIEDDSNVSGSNLILGTPGYMAPEQADGESITGRADVFSLGCVMFELATGRPPFPGKTPLQRLTALAVEIPPPVRSVNSAIPEPLSDLIVRLLLKDPAGRPDAAEVATELRPFAGATSIVAVPLAQEAVEDPFESIVESGQRPRQRIAPATQAKPRGLKWLAIPAAAIVAFFAVAIAWKMWPKEVERPPDRPSTPDPSAGQPATPPEKWPPLNYATMAPRDQLDVLGRELSRRNSGFDPKRTGAFGRHLGRDRDPVLDVFLVVGDVELRDLSPLAALPKLTQVSLTSQRPAKLAGLRELPLTYLSLTSIPNPDLASLGPMTTLRTALFDRTTGLDLKALSTFSNLKTLTIRAPGNDIDFGPLKLFKNLESLDLSESGIVDIGPVAGLTKLQTLKFRECDVRDVAPLASLVELTEIDCKYRPAYGPVLEKLPKLQRINGELKDQFLGDPKGK